MRRIIITTVLALVAVVALASVAVAVGGGSTVTKPRLERSMAATFAGVYTQEAALLGHPGVTPATLNVRAMCDNGAGDVGPGGTWICLLSWHDPNTPMPSAGYGKFELNVHSNDCYTAGAPSSLVGFQTITDAQGRTVTNPAFEFDGCFDPRGDNTPTGVSFPSSFSITTTALAVDTSGGSSLALACGTGAAGCAGTITASVEGQAIGSVPFTMAENATSTVRLPGMVPASAKEVDLAVTLTQGVGSSGATLPVEGRAG